MSMNHLPAAALAIAASMGWNEESVLIHLNSFVDENDLTEDLAAHARKAAEEEGVEVDESASFDDVVDEAAWDEDSQIIHIVGVINDKDMDAELATYFDAVAEEERDAAEDDEDGFEDT